MCARAYEPPGLQPAADTHARAYRICSFSKCRPPKTWTEVPLEGRSRENKVDEADAKEEEDMEDVKVGEEEEEEKEDE